MKYAEFNGGDTKLIKFIDKNPDGEGGAFDEIVYVKFPFDLSSDQLDMIKQAAEDTEYEGYSEFRDWVDDVVGKAEDSDRWYDKKGGWVFWDPYPCLEIEV